MTPRATRRLRLAAIGLALLVLAWLASASFVAFKLTHRRHPPFSEPIPADLLSTTEGLRLTTTDHEQIGAWLIAPQPNQPIVVLLHGLGGNRSALVSRARILAHSGYGVLALTLRGHGDSTGETIDVGWSARFDLLAAVDYLREHHPDARIVVDGASMGAAAALFAAPDIGGRVCGYVLECPYSDLCTAIKNRFELALPPVLDSIAYAGLRTVAPIFLPDLDRIVPVDYAHSIPVETPVLILSSLADRHARPDEARAIFERIKDHATLVWFDDAAHDRLVESHPDQWKATVTSFIDKTGVAPIRSR